MGDESPGPHSRDPINQRVDITLKIVQPGDLRLDEILRDASRPAQQIAVDLPQQLGVLVEQRFAEVRHLCHVPERAQGCL